MEFNDKLMLYFSLLSPIHFHCKWMDGGYGASSPRVDELSPIASSPQRQPRHSPEYNVDTSHCKPCHAMNCRQAIRRTWPHPHSRIWLLNNCSALLRTIHYNGHGTNLTPALYFGQQQRCDRPFLRWHSESNPSNFPMAECSTISCEFLVHRDNYRYRNS